MDHKNIHEALHAIYNDVGYVQKQKSDGLKYAFASEGAFIKELRPSMIEHGVTISVAKMDSLVQENYESRNQSSMTRSVIHGVVRFTHISGTWVDVESYGEAADTGDKSVNKAMTDLYKYALRQTFMIETGDDPDKEAPPERSAKQNIKDLGFNDEPSMTEAAKRMGAVEGMTVEMAKSAKSEGGKTYGELAKEELVVRFNSLSKKRRDKPDEFTEEDKFKMDAAKVLIANWGKK